MDDPLNFVKSFVNHLFVLSCLQEKIFKENAKTDAAPTALSKLPLESIKCINERIPVQNRNTQMKFAIKTSNLSLNSISTFIP